MIGRSASEILTDYVEATALIEPGEVLRVVVHDADDDQVIAAAVASRADLIVSGDRRHLLPLGSHQGIDIVEPAEAFVRQINGSYSNVVGLPLFETANLLAGLGYPVVAQWPPGS